MTPWYVATGRFGPHRGEPWTEYIAWSGLAQLEELVTLDPMLCPSVLPEILDDHCPHIVCEDFMSSFLVDLPFLMGAVAEIPDRQIIRDPDSEPQADPDWPAFEFLGYDLCDTQGGISALSNCGGFPDAFANAELSSKGLLTSRARALQVQDDLRRLHPDEPHADCHVWAISRLVEG